VPESKPATPFLFETIFVIDIPIQEKDPVWPEGMEVRYGANENGSSDLLFGMDHFHYGKTAEWSSIPANGRCFSEADVQFHVVGGSFAMVHFGILEADPIRGPREPYASIGLMPDIGAQLPSCGSFRRFPPNP
jgi:hypothetical protein